jgi:hypothetical protein
MMWILMKTQLPHTSCTCKFWENWWNIPTVTSIRKLITLRWLSICTWLHICHGFTKRNMLIPNPWYATCTYHYTFNITLSQLNTIKQKGVQKLLHNHTNKTMSNVALVYLMRYNRRIVHDHTNRTISIYSTYQMNYGRSGSVDFTQPHEQDNVKSTLLTKWTTAKVVLWMWYSTRTR